MEHLWHCLFCIALAFLAAHDLSLPSSSTSPKIKRLIIITTLISSALRLETIFVSVILASLYVARRDYKFAALMVFASLIPLMIFACYSFSHDGYLLPYSVLIKSKLSGRSLIDAVRVLILTAQIFRFDDAPALVLLFLWSLIRLLLRLTAQPTQIDYARIIFVGGVILQFVFGDFGWLMRYESYLLFIGLLCFAHDLFHLKPQRGVLGPAQQIAVMTAIVSILLGSAWRIKLGITNTQKAISERAIEHLPAATLIARHYHHSAIIAGDVGMISFWSDARIYDVYGLAMQQSCQEILANRRSMGGIGKVRGSSAEEWRKRYSAEIAIIKDDWMLDVPSHWIKVGRIKMKSNVVFRHYSDLNFYAFDTESADRLSRQMTDLKSSKIFSHIDILRKT
jgi:hypothetical protein